MITPVRGLRLTLLLLVVLCACTVLNAQSGPNSSVLVLDCGAAGQLTAVTPSLATPLSLNLNGTGVLIATSVTYIVTDSTTNETIFTQTSTYAAGHRRKGTTGGLISCTSDPVPFSDPQIGDGTLTLIVMGFQKP